MTRARSAAIRNVASEAGAVPLLIAGQLPEGAVFGLAFCMLAT